MLQSRSAFRQGLIALLLLLPLLFGLLVVIDVALLTATLFTLTLMVQFAGGATIWLAFRGKSDVGTAELLGVGLAIGTVVSVILAQILLPFDLGAWAFLVAGILPLCLWSLPSTRTRLLSFRSATPSTGMFVALLLLGLILSLFVLLPFFLTNPDADSDYVQYHLDFPFFEGLTHSVITWGGSDWIHLAGTEFRYHWLTYAWSGWESKLSLAEPLVLLTRIMPLTAVLGICLMTMAIAQSMTRKISASVLALMLVTLGIGIADSAFFGFLIVPGSPSQLLTTVWLMAAAFVLMRYVNGQGKNAGNLMVLAVLAFGSTGGKISAGVVLMGAILGVTFVSVLRRTHLTRAILALIITGISTITAFVVFIAPTTGPLTVSGNGLDIAPGLGILFGLEPAEILSPAPHIWWLIVSVAGFIVLNAKNSGILLIRPFRSNYVAVGAAAGAIAVGSLFSIASFQIGNSHLYFILTAGAIAGPIAAVGLTQYYFSHRQIAHKLFFPCIAGALLLSGLVLFSGLRIDIPGRLKLDPILYWSVFPIAVLVVTILVLFLITRATHRGLSRKTLRSLTALYSVTFLTFMSIWTGLGFGFWNLHYTLSYEREIEYSSSYGWTNAHAEALEWLRNSSAPNDLIATNRFCLKEETVPNCDSLSFVVSALSGRRMLVEGYAYSAGLGVITPWVADRVQASTDFAENPSRESLDSLQFYGVDWVVIDKAFPHSGDWTPYADVVYFNDSVIILKIN